MIVVSDTSPIIILSRIGLLSLLLDLFAEIHIPENIYDEITQAGAGRPGSSEVADARGTWVTVHPTRPSEARERFRQHQGPSHQDVSVIALAEALASDLILVDERPLRKTVLAEGFMVTGVGGILYRAKRENLVESLREPLDHAIAEGLYLAAPLRNHLLRLAGEINEH